MTRKLNARLKFSALDPDESLVIESTVFQESLSKFLYQLYELSLQWPFLLSATVIAFSFLYLKEDKAIFTTLKKLFHPKLWLHKSSIMDFKIGFMNAFLFAFVLPTSLIASDQVADFIFNTSESLFGGKQAVNGQSTLMGNLIFSGIVLLMTDFIAYLNHYLGHKNRFLWEFHKLHHSAEVLTPFTTFRTHPMMTIVIVSINSLALGFVFGGFKYFVNIPVSEISIYGMNVFSFFIHLFGGLLTHSHIRLQFPKPLAMLIVSPLNHQVHHSSHEIHFDKNFGFWLSIWDVMFGTFYHVKSEEEFEVGLGVHDKGHNSLKEAYLDSSLGALKTLVK